MELNKSINVTLGTLSTTVYGGRFRDFDTSERRLVGIKMAVEIDHDHHISIPTADYSVPTQKAMQHGIALALYAIEQGNDLYVGCMGGIGRTGLFMGCMLKLVNDYYQRETDPVLMVRKGYKAHAIETPEQMYFVRNFDTTELLVLVKKLQTTKIIYVEQPVPVPVVIHVYMTPWQWLLTKLGKICN